MDISLVTLTIVAKSKIYQSVRVRLVLISKWKCLPVWLIISGKSGLTPYADKNGRIIEFDKILLSGAQFIKQQAKGYQMYQNFINSIIPDSAYMQYLFDSKGYQKALLDIEEQFYYSWQKELLSQQRFVDWRSIRNKRHLLFNGLMERNRATVNPKSWKQYYLLIGLNVIYREHQVNGIIFFHRSTISCRRLLLQRIQLRFPNVSSTIKDDGERA